MSENGHLHNGDTKLRYVTILLILVSGYKLLNFLLFKKIYLSEKTLHGKWIAVATKINAVGVKIWQLQFGVAPTTL